MPKKMHKKVIIIGSGPAGYTAAIYAARAGLEPVIIAGTQPGGQMTITTDVENYPGFAKVIQGPWLMDEMRQQAISVGAQIIQDTINNVDFRKSPFVLYGDGNMRYTAESVIIATGAKARWLGLASEKRFQGRGVSACATCDGFFFKNKDVVVVGGGNTAVEEALYLTHHASHVTLIHRRDQLRAEHILVQRIEREKKINIVWNSVIKEVLGDDSGVNAVLIEDIDDRASRKIDCAGVFIAIGHDPATAVFRGHVAMDDDGYIRTKSDSTQTDIKGVFAAGDVADRHYRQAVTAAGQGCMSAIEVERYLGQNTP